MGRWLERYEQGQHRQVWTEMTSLGSDLRRDDAALSEAEAVARETMRRARQNVERLVERLPAHGFRFESDPLVDPPSDAASRLDALEAEIGVLPIRASGLVRAGRSGQPQRHPSFEYPATFVNYLRIAFAMGGMPGWQREPALLEDWALPHESPPAWLLELGRELLPV